MAWIESHSNLIDHHKTRKAARELNIKPVQLVGHITCLWHKVIEIREDGDISDWTADDVSHYAQWEGNADDFYSALVSKNGESAFIDIKNSRKLIHDWLDFAWRYLYGKYHTSNPKLLLDIKKRHGIKGGLKSALKSPKGEPPNLPNLTYQTYLTLFPPDFQESEEFQEVAQLWVTHRKEIRKPLKETSGKTQADRLVKMGLERSIAAMKRSVENGWTGIHEKEERGGGLLK